MRGPTPTPEVTRIRGTPSNLGTPPTREHALTREATPIRRTTPSQRSTLIQGIPHPQIIPRDIHANEFVTRRLLIPADSVVASMILRIVSTGGTVYCAIFVARGPIEATRALIRTASVQSATKLVTEETPITTRILWLYVKCGNTALFKTIFLLYFLIKI